MHTRLLMGQPGAAVRLSAVYRYVVAAARDRLAGEARRVRACPGCQHDDAAAGRAPDTLLDGLDDPEAMSRCRDLGGVCIPHLTAAASCAQRDVADWLAETMRETLAASPARPEAESSAAGRVLAGVRDAQRASQQTPLCVRHVLSLREADQRAGRAAARHLVEVADALIGELAGAFPAAAESTAWRRALAFLDGGVLGGSPPR